MVTAGNRRRFGMAMPVLHLGSWQSGSISRLMRWLPITVPTARPGQVDADHGLGHARALQLVAAEPGDGSRSPARFIRAVTSTCVLSSPVSPSRLFSVRIATNGLLIAVMALVLSAPLIDVLALVGGPRWLAGYAVSLSVGFAAAALAVAITMVLFRVLGPRRTRLVAQVLAAIIGASFAIGVQVIAILYYGSFAQRIFVASDSMVAHSPPEDSLLWLPARAVLGDPWSLTVVVVVAIGILALVIVTFAPRMGEHSIAATDLPAGVGRHRSRRQFPAGSPAAAMRRKEWLRDSGSVLTDQRIRADLQRPRSTRGDGWTFRPARPKR